MRFLCKNIFSTTLDLRLYKTADLFDILLMLSLVPRKNSHALVFVRLVRKIHYSFHHVILKGITHRNERNLSMITT